MKLRQLISKINWRQVIIHCLAAWFFIQGFKLIPYVLYPDVVRAGLNRDLNSSSNLFMFTILLSFAPLTGLLTACLISYLIAVKKKWFGINSLVVLLVLFPLYRLDLLGWNYAKLLFLYPSIFFDDIGIKLLVTISILLIIGGLLFFLPLIIRYIDKADAERKKLFLLKAKAITLEEIERHKE